MPPRTAIPTNSLGSVLNHVLLHQTVIGQEAKLQMKMAGEEPDVVIACFGGGSNFRRPDAAVCARPLRGKGPRILAIRTGGLPHPHARQVHLRLRRHRQVDAAAENAHAGPRLRAAGNSRRRAALPRRVAAGQPPGEAGHIEAKAYTQIPVFEAAVQFARTEGILPAPEARTPFAALSTKPSPPRRGPRPDDSFRPQRHGHFDLAAYENYISGKLVDYEFPGREIAEAIAGINSGV